MDRFWEVTFRDGEVVNSLNCADPRLLPNKAIIAITQFGYAGEEILVTGSRFIFTEEVYDGVPIGWFQMEADTEALTVKLRVEVHNWRCYRPGWWDAVNPRFKERWEAAAYRLEKQKERLGD